MIFFRHLTIDALGRFLPPFLCADFGNGTLIPLRDLWNLSRRDARVARTLPGVERGTGTGDDVEMISTAGRTLVPALHIRKHHCGQEFPPRETASRPRRTRGSFSRVFSVQKGREAGSTET